jgi:hypothetical protein
MVIYRKPLEKIFVMCFANNYLEKNIDKDSKKIPSIISCPAISEKGDSQATNTINSNIFSSSQLKDITKIAQSFSLLPVKRPYQNGPIPLYQSTNSNIFSTFTNRQIPKFSPHLSTMLPWSARIDAQFTKWLIVMMDI